MSAISVEMWGQGNPPMGAEQVLFIAGGPALSYTVRRPCADRTDQTDLIDQMNQTDFFSVLFRSAAPAPHEERRMRVGR